MTEVKRGRPKLNREGQEELDKVEQTLDSFSESMHKVASDPANKPKAQEVEPQTKLSQREIADSKDIYLKPLRYIASKEKFNERLREKYEFAKEYVYFIAENNEVVGEEIETWTKNFPGVPAEFWRVPVTNRYGGHVI